MSKLYAICLLCSCLFGVCGAVQADQYVVVVLDDSGSMADAMRGRRIQRMDAAKQALATVLNDLPDDAHVGILALNNDWVLPVGPVQQAEVAAALQRLDAQGGTPLGAYMTTATNELLRLRQEHRYGDFRLLVVTDGEANDQDVLDRVLPDIMSRGLLVDVIGVDMQSQHSLATVVHNYRRADDPQALAAAIKQSLAESDDSGPDSEDDFALIAGLPAEMSMDVVTALADLNSAPIGERNVSLDEAATMPVAQPAAAHTGGGWNPGGAGTTGNAGANRPVARQSWGPYIFLLLAIVALFVVSTFSSAAKSRRGR